MKSSFTTLIALAASVSAHYNFPALISSDGVVQPDWEHVRRRGDGFSNGFHDDVTSTNIRCGINPAIAPSTLEVAAGSKLGFRIDSILGHPGPASVYLAKAPAGETAKTFNGDGAVWFKIFEMGAYFNEQGLQWESWNLEKVNFTIPAATPPGDYLVRFEHIALHAAGELKGAQIYIACGQITVTGNGAGTPGPLVSIPGLYTATDPGILIGIYYPPVTNYTVPGPPVWNSGDAGEQTPPIEGPATTAVPTTAAPVPTTLVTATRPSTTRSASVTAAPSPIATSAPAPSATYTPPVEEEEEDCEEL